MKIKSSWLQSLEGKHVLITGGSSGIGLAIAKEALSQGAFITLVARSSSKLDQAAESLAKDGGAKHKISTKVADVGDYGTLAKALKESFEWRAVDVLVCNAAAAKVGVLDEGRIEDLHAMIQTNLTGCQYSACWDSTDEAEKCPNTHVHCSHEFPGRTGMLMYPHYGTSVYVATKYALKGLGETLKIELMPYNIRISIVFPGFVETPMLDYCGLEDDRDILQIIKATCFYNRSRADTPEHVAKYTLEATKNGTFLVTSQFAGLAFSTLSRGTMPADSFGMALVELILFIPIRLFSFLVACYVFYVIEHRHNKKC